jgi:hypothetical protein
MKFTKQDLEDYISYLKEEIEKTKKYPEDIYNNYYINNLYLDLQNLNKN